MSKIYRESSNAEKVAAIYWTVILGTVTALLVTLKLVNVIGWSWWWVVSPVFLLIGLLIAIWVIYVNNKVVDIDKNLTEW